MTRLGHLTWRRPEMHWISTRRYLGALWASRYCIAGEIQCVALGVTRRQAERRASRKYAGQEREATQ